MEQNLEPIRSKIYEIRGQRVMSSHHTDKKDLDDWKSQFATSGKLIASNKSCHGDKLSPKLPPV